MSAAHELRYDWASDAANPPEDEAAAEYRLDLAHVEERHHRTRPCLVHELSAPCGPDGYCWRHERSALVAERYLRMKARQR